MAAWRPVWRAALPMPRILADASQGILTQRMYSDESRGDTTVPTSLDAQLREWQIAKPLRSALQGTPFHFSQLTDVQNRVLSLLPAIAEGENVLSDGKSRDVLCKARTGTGKTVAFLVPAIQARIHAVQQLEQGHASPSFRAFLERNGLLSLLEKRDRASVHELKRLFRRHSAGVLVVSPTRELAMQIANEAKKLVSQAKHLYVHTLVGGVSVIPQRKQWERYEPDIVVGTPGRLLDLMNNRSVRDAFSRTQTLVLDEADMLLELGFREDIQTIISGLPPVEERTTFLFSATMDRSIMGIAEASLHEQYRLIDCIPPGEDQVHKRIPQYVTTIQDPSELVPYVMQLLAQDQRIHGNRSKVMIFTSTTKLTDMMYHMIHMLAPTLPGSSDTRVFGLHSLLSQARRSKISQEFRHSDAKPSVLLTSDVSARGVDYPSVTRVIQLGVPPSKEMYVHRVGRTGRRGRDGRADLVVTDFESAFVAFQLNEMPLQPLALTDEPEPELDQDALRTSIAHAQERLRQNKEGVRDVFSGLFGYYISNQHALRVPPAHILHSVQRWIQGVLALPTAPEPNRSIMHMVHASSTKFGSGPRPAKRPAGRSVWRSKSAYSRPPKHIRQQYARD